MPQEIDRHRRQFFGIAAATLAAGLGVTASASARAGKINLTNPAATRPGTNTSFGSLKQIDAGLLNVGYAEAGSANGPVAILLHGWPYDIHSYVDGCYPKSVISVRPGGERAHSSDIWRR